MKNRIHQIRLFAALALAIYLCGLLQVRAQTYTWADNAQGQPYLICPTELGPSTNYYPSNSFWGQSVQTNSNCNNTATVQSAPSNWDPPPPLGIFPGGPGSVGVSVLIGAPAPTVLNEVVSVDSLIIQTNGQLELLDSTYLTANYYEFQGDGALLDIGTTGGTPGIAIAPEGSMVKSGGVGAYSIELAMTGTSNTFEVDSGTLAFPTGFHDANLDGGTFNIATNATLLLTADANATPLLNGSFNGLGAGVVLFNNGGINTSGCDLNFPGSMFQWTGGTLEGGPFTNSGVFNLTNALGFHDGFLYNEGLINLADNSSLNFSGDGGTIYNETNAVFDIEGDSSLLNGGVGFDNYGLLWKSAGSGLSQITAILKNYGGTVEADSGTLALNVSGGGYISNAVFVVSNGAAIDLITSNYNMEIEGALTGTGGGTILMSAGTLSSSYTTTFNFPGAMFQWAGGKLGDDYANNVSNINTMTVSGPVGIDGVFGNNGTMIQSGAGSINGGSDFYNYANALYDIQNDGGITVDNFYNYGLLEKTGGTNISVISSDLYNYGPGAVNVSAATLVFSGPNDLFTNTSFSVSNGATLVFAPNNVNFSQEMEGATIGSGGGSVVLSNGVIFSDFPATLNFSGAMFQWMGGKIGSQNNPSLLTNIGVINVSGPVALNEVMANSGSMIQVGAGSIGGGDDFYNGLGAVYDIQNDGGVSVANFFNYGLWEKTSGANASLIAGNFNNWGQIQAPGGALSFTNGTFTQNTGTLQLSAAVSLQGSIQQNGGTITGVGAMGNPGDVSMNVSGGTLAPGNPVGSLSWLGHFGFSMTSAAALDVTLGGSNQFSQLVVPNSSATVAGTLNVTLANGFTSPVGAQFQIVSTGNRGGTFSSVNVPRGISVTYSNTGVFLTVTSPVPAQLTTPQLSGSDFTFGFGTVSNQSYTIQQNTDLTTTNWIFYTNFIGDGSFFQFISPLTNVPQNFFQVREP